MTRRKFLGAAASAGSLIASPFRSLAEMRLFRASPRRSEFVIRAGETGGGASVPIPTLPKFRVRLPQKILPLPEGVMKHKTAPGFKLRGIKGWAWVAEQYLDTIPVMAKYRMNFLMNCYSSLWDLEVHDGWARIPDRPVNHWYKPLPEAKKAAYERVVQACQRQGIEFCFSMNPNLSSDQPFDYAKPSDFEKLWRHYAWAQGLGVRWFNLSLDDIRQGIDAGAQVKTANEVFRRLRAQNPQAQFIFTPTWYAGTGQSGTETPARLGTGDTAGIRYTKEIAEKLDRQIYLYWTGPEVCSLTITREDAEAYKALAKHRLFIWDNYPCNDAKPTLQLGPLMGRDPELFTLAEGYISNPLSPQDEANQIPMLTIADYLWNPEAYDPGRSIGQAVAHLGKTAGERLALKGLVDLYPGRLVDKSFSTGWNSLQERFRLALERDSEKTARKIILHAQDVSQRMAESFPNRFVRARKVLEADINEIQADYSKKHS